VAFVQQYSLFRKIEQAIFLNKGSSVCCCLGHSFAEAVHNITGQTQEKY
jgi:hypothetical protein